MNKKTHKKYVALLTLLAMVICTMFCTNTVKADTNLPWDESEVVETSTCIVNGVERNLIILDDASVYLRIGESAPLLIYVGFNNVSAKFDQYGTIWVMDSRDDAIRWWNYDLSPTELDFYAINKPTAENPDAFVDDVESFILDENNKFIVGYKTFSGQTYPILTLDEIHHRHQHLHQHLHHQTFLPLLQLFLQLLLMFLLLLRQQLALLLLPQPQVLLLLLQKQP